MHFRYNFLRMFVFKFNFSKFSNQHQSPFSSSHCDSRSCILQLASKASSYASKRAIWCACLLAISQVVDFVVWCCCWKVAIKLKHKRQFSYLSYSFYFQFQAWMLLCAWLYQVMQNFANCNNRWHEINNTLIFLAAN
jgi:hypothetical protein